MTPPDRVETERPLISNATILILSGYLIGMTVGRYVPDDLAPYIFACGVCGFLSFVALELNSERRRESAARAEESRLSARLNRHVDVITTGSVCETIVDPRNGLSPEPPELAIAPAQNS